MNLMVVLVPFLLITAVFSRMAILELNLPADGVAGDEPPMFALEVVLRGNRIDLNDRQSGPLASLPHVDGRPDLKAVSDYMQRIKQRFPDETSATLLLEPDVVYEQIVDVMDVVRAVAVKDGGATVFAELFPAISIGDAPPAPTVAAAGD
ncbi:MAG: biopolymer transporter ExbD [Gammaproteobacteria bacterium]|nr:biopolymer transporter ExbD [Gammaproteobacteria bacterium]NNF61776.1 biopolymer transporter ExbD [Gammaproteobacteria bacterium]NNM20443.1 biopolymer transporter ExbD [Gammaproteobacteria bacterium]